MQNIILLGESGSGWGGQGQNELYATNSKHVFIGKLDKQYKSLVKKIKHKELHPNGQKEEAIFLDGFSSIQCYFLGTVDDPKVYDFSLKAKREAIKDAEEYLNNL